MGVDVRYVVLPGEIDARCRVGGKGRALAALTRAGLPVPEWFAVPPDAFEASVTGEAAARLAAASTGAEAHTLLAGVAPAERVSAQIDAALAALGSGGTYAVRSSAQEEDGARRSFAGQLESFLRVAAAQVADRVAAVWRSGFSERLVRYRREAGLAPLAGVPAVIVQRMVEGEVSGVAFSADPVSGRRGIAVVAAVRGLGESLVSGAVTGDSWRVDRAGRIVGREMGDAGESGLDDARVPEAAALARRAEALFGSPQDIEWTLADGRLWLLQSRPITTLAGLPDPDAPRMLWDNANIVESYGGVTLAADVLVRAARLRERLPRVQPPHGRPRAGDRGKRRDLRRDARPGGRTGLLQPAQLVPGRRAAAGLRGKPPLPRPDAGGARGGARAGARRRPRCDHGVRRAPPARRDGGDGRRAGADAPAADRALLGPDARGARRRPPRHVLVAPRRARRPLPRARAAADRPLGRPGAQRLRDDDLPRPAPAAGGGLGRRHDGGAGERAAARRARARERGAGAARARDGAAWPPATTRSCAPSARGRRPRRATPRGGCRRSSGRSPTTSRASATAAPGS